MIRSFLAVVAVVLPQRLKHLVYRWGLGWEIDPTARIGASLIMVDHAVIGPDVTMSHLNVFKGLELLQLDRSVAIGAFNWVSGPAQGSGAFPHSPDRSPSLVMGEGAGLVTRHVLDCSDRITFEPFSTMGGNRSQVLSHAIDLDRNVQTTSPVVIGRSSLVLTGCILLAGSRVPPRCVVASGAVVHRDLGEELHLYGGVPARPIKEIAPDNAYLNRTKGYVT